MIDAAEIKKGTAIELDGNIYQVVECEHTKMQQRQPVIKLRLRDVRSGNVIDRNFQAGDKVTSAFLEHRPVQYLYNDGNLYYFMDNESYEQIELTSEQIGRYKNYLKEGLNLEILTCKDEAINIDLPIAVDLQVIETDPGFKGNTATGGNKPAKLETGVSIQIPLFINIDDIIKVDTRTGAYIEKVS